MANFQTGATTHSVARSQHSTKYIQSLSAAAAARLGEAKGPIPLREHRIASEEKLGELALLSAIQQVANKYDLSITQLVDKWEAGE